VGFSAEPQLFSGAADSTASLAGFGLGHGLLLREGRFSFSAVRIRHAALA